MKNSVEDFLDKNNTDFISSYTSQILSNLADLNKRESKHFIGLALVLLLYMLLRNNHVNEIDLGFFIVKEKDLIISYMPILFIYLLMSLYSITFQIKESQRIIEDLIGAKLLIKKDDKLKYTSSRFSRAFFPYSFATQVKSIFNSKPTAIQALIGFIILLPILIVALVPHVIVIFMIIDTYYLNFEIVEIKIAFWVSIWVYVLLWYYIIANGLAKKE